MSSTQSVKNIMSKTPIKYEFAHDPIHSFASPEIATTIRPVEHQSTPQSRSDNVFVLSCYHSDYNHTFPIDSSPIHGPWPQNDASKKENFATRALKKVLPDDMAADALSDWETGRQLLDEVSTLPKSETKARRDHDFAQRRIARAQQVREAATRVDALHVAAKKLGHERRAIEQESRASREQATATQAAKVAISDDA